ncbi:MAG: MXAN_5187 C-terminal domain-containing protein [Myxococcota bacterium]|nr:MXAN_5187 C-terminal domain-containing protein [Myxococcota bacterium]
MSLEDDLLKLDSNIGQLKQDYEQYFLGIRPTEPQSLRSLVQTDLARLSGQPIQNTAERFRFNGLHARFQSFRRRWDATLREIEAGTYKRHLFKIGIREKNQANESMKPARPDGSAGDLFADYQSAADRCGQSLGDLTAEKLKKAVQQQEQAIRAKLGCERVDFRVVVEAGRVKVKASAAPSRRTS